MNTTWRENYSQSAIAPDGVTCLFVYVGKIRVTVNITEKLTFIHLVYIKIFSLIKWFDNISGQI